MDPISKPVERKDHKIKIRGEAKYVNDHKTDSHGEPMLTARLVRSSKTHAKLLKINVPALPEGYYFLSAKDLPCNVSYYPCNDLPLSTPEQVRYDLSHSMPILADDEVLYYGQPFGIMVGPSEGMVRKLVSETTAEYEEYPAVIDFMQSKKSFLDVDRLIGNTKDTFMDTDDFYIERTITGRQYQAYIETQGIMAEYDNGRMLIHGSLQCPYVVRASVAFALNLDESMVQIRQDVTGGGFGGKEEFPCFLASQAAAAAFILKKPVRLIFDRNEDLQFASKRHPSYTSVRFGVKDGEITAVDIKCLLDAGAYITSSVDVAMTYFAKIPCVYSFPNLHVHVSIMQTNTPPCGAFRGFGNPQAVFAIETAMNHLAADLGVDEIEFKRKYMAKTGGPTSTNGIYHEPVPLDKMLAAAVKATNYNEKRAEYAKPQTGRFRKGIGLSFGNQGATLPGAAEWKGVKANVKLVKNSDDTVVVYTGQSEIGQGVQTTYSKIVAKTLDIPYEQVSCIFPNTDLCADSGPTAASRSAVIVGEAVRRAAVKLKEAWTPGKEQTINEEYTYEAPKFGGYDEDNFVGDSYSHYLWMVTVIEVQVDMCTGGVEILNAHGVCDIGTPLDYNIALGQMEGGFLQGIGYASSERMVIGESGKMYNTAFADYPMPTFCDVPNMSIEFFDDPYEGGPFGARGAGELPVVGAPPAYINAIEQALGGTKDHKLNKIPFVPEDVIKATTVNGNLL